MEFLKIVTGRVLTETGNLENKNGHGKVMVHEKLANMAKVMEFCDKSWNLTNFAPKLSQICNVFCKMLQMQNLEDRWSLEIKKWSWKIHKNHIVKSVETLAGDIAIS